MDERTLNRDPFALIVGRAHDSLPDRISLKDAGRLRRVLPEAQGVFRRQVDALFIAAGAAVPDDAVPDDAVRCDPLLTTKVIVRTSTRVTILARQVAAAELSIGVLRAIAVKEASFGRSIGALWLKSHPLSSMAARVIEPLAVWDIDSAYALPKNEYCT